MWLTRLGHDNLVSQQFFKCGYGLRGHLHSLSQNPAQLNDDDLTDEQLMFCYDVSKQIGAQAAGGRGAHQDIGVQEHPHEIALKMSSSVR